MNNIILIPSARLIPSSLQMDFGGIPSAMIPLNNKPALSYILKNYSQNGFSSIIAVHDGASQVVDFIKCHPELNSIAIDVGETKSLGETVFNSLNHLKLLPDRLIINFGDTYIEDELTKKDTICYVVQEDVYRWTTFNFDSSYNIFSLQEKDQAKSQNGGLPVFVGVFQICNVSDFIMELKKSLLNNDSSEVDPFYVAIMEYFNSLEFNNKFFQNVEKWYDFGHLDTYYTTKREFGLNKRYFNDVRVDLHRGILHKESKDSQKFSNEIKWYLKLPKTLQHIAPRVLDYSLDYHNPYIEMEFYGYPALNDVYLYGDHNIGIWNQVLTAIKQVLKEIQSFHFTPAKNDELVIAMKHIYEEKTYKRLIPIIEDEKFSEFNTEKLIINNKECIGLKKFFNVLPYVILNSGLYNQEFFTIIHGDLCLSNILYDPRNVFIRVVDPRGGFGVFDIYGDPRYDIAKLSHSFEGNYDFLVNGLFKYKHNSDGIFLEANLDDRHKAVQKLFNNWINKDWGNLYNQIKLIESLLFLSMVPLHADRFLSQKAFLTRGLELFSEIAKKYN